MIKPSAMKKPALTRLVKVIREKEKRCLHGGSKTTATSIRAMVKEYGIGEVRDYYRWLCVQAPDRFYDRDFDDLINNTVLGVHV